ncbi:carbohydrate-binding module family 43 protein [Lophiostoma macrostomum CBS 122681]|uniref:1,3-beta-glucanosyltransferase n=1 Tax=Lophiostoma macrostomum CBS 122681 TaxID=1314788 RepID=A0A6A6T4P2_9PLEO|nr:carbohydrate-binding module family 43 protein [Lophiostoma macrostomum CBS 122681]
MTSKGYDQSQFLWLLLLVLALRAVAQVDTIVIKGSRFFYNSNGSEFILRGIAYQSYFWTEYFDPSNYVVDPLGEVYTRCETDIQYFRQLRINVVRTYALDLNLPDHGPCLNALADAGIYVFADLSTVNATMNINNTWDTTILKQFTAAVDTLAAYPNVLGVGVGNPRGSFTSDDSSSTIPFYKAAVRDIKRYIKEKAYREIPVGIELGPYKPPDIFNQVDYVTCDQIRPDFIGLTLLLQESIESDNCTEPSLIDEIVGNFSNFPVPLFISGYGCYLPNGVSHDVRDWKYLPTIYSDKASEVLTGGILQSYFQTFDSESDYGIVQFDQSDGSITPLSAFSNISSVMTAIKPTSTDLANYTPSSSTPACPTLSEDWNTSAVLPPTPYEPLCSCMYDSLRCVLKGDANIEQTAGYNSLIIYGDNKYGVLEDVCEGPNNCKGIWGRLGTGEYGAFSACNMTTRWSWAANEYWKKHGECRVNGTAELRDEPTPPSSDCSFLLQQVGDDGDKTLTATLTPSATADVRSSPSTPALGPGGLSTGAKAGIGVSISVFGIAVISGVLFILHRRRQMRPTTGQPDHPELVTTGVEKYRYTLSPQFSPGADVPPAAYISPDAELPAKSRPSEAPSNVAMIPAVNYSPVELAHPITYSELAADGRSRTQSLSGSIHTAGSEDDSADERGRR